MAPHLHVATQVLSGVWFAGRVRVLSRVLVWFAGEKRPGRSPGAVNLERHVTIILLNEAVTNAALVKIEALLIPTDSESLIKMLAYPLSIGIECSFRRSIAVATKVSYGHAFGAASPLCIHFLEADYSEVVVLVHNRLINAILIRSKLCRETRSRGEVSFSPKPGGRICGVSRFYIYKKFPVSIHIIKK